MRPTRGHQPVDVKGHRGGDPDSDPPGREAGVRIMVGYQQGWTTVGDIVFIEDVR